MKHPVNTRNQPPPEQARIRSADFSRVGRKSFRYQWHGYRFVGENRKSVPAEAASPQGRGKPRWYHEHNRPPAELAEDFLIQESSSAERRKGFFIFGYYKKLERAEIKRRKSGHG